MASMLDWLIPTGMEGDIASPMMNIKEFYDFLTDRHWRYGYVQDEWDAQSAEYGLDRPGPNMGGWYAPPGAPGAHATYHPKDFEDLSEEELENFEAYHSSWVQRGNPLTPESILPRLGGGIGTTAMSGDWGGETPITPGAVKPIELQDLQKLHTGFYSKDYLAPQRQTLEDLFKGKKETISGFGKGISGYGKRRGLMESAGESFRSGIDNLYSTIDKYKGNAMQRIYDIIDEWGQMTSGFGG